MKVSAGCFIEGTSNLFLPLYSGNHFHIANISTRFVQGRETSSPEASEPNAPTWFKGPKYPGIPRRSYRVEPPTSPCHTTLLLGNLWEPLMGIYFRDRPKGDLLSRSSQKSGYLITWHFGNNVVEVMGVLPSVAPYGVRAHTRQTCPRIPLWSQPVDAGGIRIQGLGPSKILKTLNPKP